tara:strand:+ start:561 stop:767 length:207 start_codon:yes stop_codon:yes gene_type:complete
MCLICLEFEKESRRTMTIKEARRNFLEISSSLEEDHRQEVLDMLDRFEEEELMKDYYDWLFLDEGGSD